MKRKVLIISVAVAVVVLGFLAFLFFHEREPRYEGRTLAKWLDDAVGARFEYYQKHRENPPLLTNDSRWLDARAAVKQMGSDAIPWLLKWFQARDSSLKQRLVSWLYLHPGLHLHVEEDWMRNREGWEGLVLLGDDAKPAWPALIRLMESSDYHVRWRVVSYLSDANVGKEMLLPVLLRALHDPNHGVTELAARVLHSRYPQEAEAAGVYKMFPGLKNESAEPRATK